MASCVPSIADIQREVCAHYHLPAEAMREPDGVGARLRDRSRPRQLAMCLASRLTRHSSIRIGQLFGGRDHSTVIKGVAAVERRIGSDPETREAARTLTKRLLPMIGVM